MEDEKPQVGAPKNLRVSGETHRRFLDYQYRVRARSAEDAMRLLLGEDVVRVPVPDVVRERWEAAAEAAGFPLAQWIVQRIEAALAYSADPRDIRQALDSALAALWGKSVPTGTPDPPSERTP